MKHFSPQLLFLLLFLQLGSYCAQAQNTVTIPDPQMAYFFQQIYPTCITGNQLDTTCNNLLLAQYISVANRNIANFEGLQYFKNLLRLTVSDNPATSLPPLANTIEELYAKDIPLTSLPTLPDSLFRLELDDNNLTSLPALPAKLTILRCERNLLTSLPTLPPDLFSLIVQHNQITALPPLPNSLSTLIVYNNQLTALPATLPPNLTHLDFKSNQVSVLPPLPNTLGTLAMSSNNISTLPATLPPNLTSFYCGYNNISVMPPLPPNLWQFACGRNNISTMPPFPSTLTSIYCHENNFTTLPPVPNGCRSLFIMDNQLTAFPGTIPDSIINMNISGNQIECIPPLPTGSNYYLTLFPNPATCLPNYGAWMSTWASGAYLNYPLCVVGDPLINPNGCADGTGIYGAVYQDNNSNCTFNTTEPGVPNIPMNLYDGGGSLIEQAPTTYTGYHYFDPGANGTYDVEMDTSQTPFLSRACPGGNSQSATLSAAVPVVNNVDFDLECNGSLDLGVQSINTQGIAFPGQNHGLRVGAGDLSQWYGFACASGVSGSIQVTVSGPVTYAQPLTGAVTPAVASNVFTYTVSDFGTFDFSTSIGLEFMTDTTATAADTICVDVVVTSGATDLDPANNTRQFCYPVRNSYDPNEKETFPTRVEAGYEGWLTYTIHFQNTGNAPAFEVDLLDTLDANLDLSTFQVLGYSHQNRSHVTGNRLTVKFPNIQLPDSTTDYLGSMGYFQYRVKPVSGLPMGAQIFNTAHIFFDFNAPIVTNTTVNDFNLTVGREQWEVEAFLKVYPNPSTGKIAMEWANYTTQATVSVVNVLGQTLQTVQQDGTQLALDLSDLKNGVYFLQYQDVEGRTDQVRMVIAK